MFRRAAAVLRALVAEIAAIRGGVRDVPRADVVHDRLAGLGEVGDEAVHEHEDEEEPHGLWMLGGAAPRAQRGPFSPLPGRRSPAGAMLADRVAAPRRHIPNTFFRNWIADLHDFLSASALYSRPGTPALAASGFVKLCFAFG